MQGAWVGSLVRELRSYMSHSATKEINKQIENFWKKILASRKCAFFITSYSEMSLLLLLLLSRFSHVRLCATPPTAAHQAPLSLGFSRQEHWSGLRAWYIIGAHDSLLVDWVNKLCALFCELYLLVVKWVSYQVRWMKRKVNNFQPTGTGATTPQSGSPQWGSLVRRLWINYIDTLWS